MSRVRVHNFSVSLDGFATGEGQTLEAPFGHAGGRLTEWFFGTRTFRQMHGEPGGTTGADRPSRAPGGRESEPRSWAAINSDHSAVRGLTKSGKVGGVTIPSFIRPSSC